MSVQALAPVLLELDVPGKPRAQGSLALWRAPDGSERAKYAPDVVAHRNLVVGCLRQAWGPRPRLTSGASIMLEFSFTRPKAHYGTGRNAATLNGRAPRHHTQYPDLDKLVRLVFDAMTVAQVWGDDAQAVVLVAQKRWADQATTRIRLWAA